MHTFSMRVGDEPAFSFLGWLSQDLIPCASQEPRKEVVPLLRVPSKGIA